MDKLHHSLLLHILSLLDNSADVARCRVASKAFNDVFPGLRSVDLRCIDINSRSSYSDSVNKIVRDIILKLETVDSLRINSYGLIGGDNHDFILSGLKAWLPMVSGSLKSLSVLSGHFPDHVSIYREIESTALPMISAYCHNLVNLKLEGVMLYVENSNPMPMLTSLTLESMYINDQNLNELNKCFPNLQVLNMVDVRGLKDPKIHLLNLKACHSDAYINNLSSLTLITPNLITLKIVCYTFDAIYVEAPMLSHFHLIIFSFKPTIIFKFKRFENLKTLSLNSFYTGSLLLEFPITNTVESVTLYSQPKAPGKASDSKLCLGKVFKVFPNVSSLYVNAYAWSGFEACFNKEGSEILDGRNRLKTICAHVLLVDPSLTFLYVACVLDQYVGLSEFSFLIHSDVSVVEFRSFMSKCMDCWPDLK